MKIILNDIAVPFANAEIEMCLRSPVFNKEDGSYIFNFTLTASEELKLALFHILLSTKQLNLLNLMNSRWMLSLSLLHKIK
jgi:hypothetical protein